MLKQSIWVVAFAVATIGISSISAYGQRTDGSGGDESRGSDRGRSDRRHNEDGGAEAEIRQLRQQVSRLSQQLETLQANAGKREGANLSHSAGHSRHQHHRSGQHAGRLNVRGRHGRPQHGFGSQQRHQGMARLQGRHRQRDLSANTSRFGGHRGSHERGRSRNDLSRYGRERGYNRFGSFQEGQRGRGAESGRRNLESNHRWRSHFGADRGDGRSESRKRLTGQVQFFFALLSRPAPGP